MSFLEHNRHKQLHLAQEQSLDSARYQKLSEILLSFIPIKTQQQWLQRVLVMLGGMCLGLALVFWVAANWDNFSLTHKFILAEGVLAVSLMLGWLQTRARSGFLLFAVLAVGGLLALYAQEYSTNTGPWRLFAIWALMALPIALAGKHQAIWIFWWLIVMIAVTLWSNQMLDRGWRSTDSGLMWVCISSGILYLISLLFYPYGLLKSWLGNHSQHAFRWAICSTLAFALCVAWMHFFWDSWNYEEGKDWFLFSLLYVFLLLGTGYFFGLYKYRDIVISAICALGLNIILVGSWIRMFANSDFKFTGWIFVTLSAGGLSLFLLIMSMKMLRKFFSANPQQNLKSSMSKSTSHASEGGAA
ncbi:MAG: DUF2157 domain-containing protein [Saezia sp.]